MQSKPVHIRTLFQGLDGHWDGAVPHALPDLAELAVSYRLNKLESRSLRLENVHMAGV